MPDPTSLTASPRHDAADVPPGVGAPPDGPDTLAIVPWPDPVIDTLGHDPRSWYVEQFWLPVIGPTSTWLLRRIVARFDAAPDGFDLNLDETARGLGLGGRDGRHSPFQRALARCVTFKLARPQGPGALGVRRRIPPLARRHLDRLPPTLQKMHDDWSTAQDRTGVLDEARRRLAAARSQAPRHRGRPPRRRAATRPLAGPPGHGPRGHRVGPVPAGLTGDLVVTRDEGYRPRHCGVRPSAAARIPSAASSVDATANRMASPILIASGEER